MGPIRIFTSNSWLHTSPTQESYHICPHMSKTIVCVLDNNNNNYYYSHWSWQWPCPCCTSASHGLLRYSLKHCHTPPVPQTLTLQGNRSACKLARRAYLVHSSPARKLSTDQSGTTVFYALFQYVYTTSKDPIPVQPLSLLRNEEASSTT